MERRFVTYVRNVTTYIIVVSRTLHSSNQHFLCGSEFIVDHKTHKKWIFSENVAKSRPWQNTGCLISVNLVKLKVIIVKKSIQLRLTHTSKID